MPATRLDPDQARALLRNYTGDAEGRAELQAAIDAQGDSEGEAQARPARAPRDPQARTVQKARVKALRPKVQAFGAGGGVAGDYRTMLAQKQLQQQQAAMAEAQARDDALAQQQQQRQAAQAQADQQQQTQKSGLRRGVSTAFDRVRGATDRLNAFADRIPTPGGLGSLFIALLLLVFFAVTVQTDKSGNGYSRAGLLWLTIRGQTTLPSAQDSQPGKAATATSGAATASGSGGLGVTATNGAQVASLPNVPNAAPPRALDGPWTFGTRWEQEF